MPTSYVLAPHDDGRMYPAELLDQYRGRRLLAGGRAVLDRARVHLHQGRVRGPMPAPL
jgi:hypothetical protein